MADYWINYGLGINFPRCGDGDAVQAVDIIFLSTHLDYLRVCCIYNTTFKWLKKKTVYARLFTRKYFHM